MNKRVLVISEGRILVAQVLRSQSLPEWRNWSHMWRRCVDPKNDSFARYGGAGIAVHDSWKDFAQFYADMGQRPTPRHTLDRYPNNAGNYEPGNVRWATPDEQNLNKKNAVFVEYEGKQQRLHALAQRFGINLNNLRGRLRSGWPLEEALSTPIDKHAKKQRRSPLTPDPQGTTP